MPSKKAHLSIDVVLRLLRKAYGPRRWSPGQDALSTLISTVLSQNTSDTNSRRAFDSLASSFASWNNVAEAEPDDIAQAIRMGGLAGIKAVRIRAILQHIKSARGTLDLEFLQELSPAAAKEWLRGLPGVGPKTAGCVLLFSLGKPVLPVDTHIFRVAKRLEVINSRISADRAHELLEAKIPPQRVYEFHLQMIEHGRRVCLARRPRCQVCILQGVCPSAAVYPNPARKGPTAEAKGLPHAKTGSRIADMSGPRRRGRSR